MSVSYDTPRVAFKSAWSLFQNFDILSAECINTTTPYFEANNTCVEYLPYDSTRPRDESNRPGGGRLASYMSHQSIPEHRVLVYFTILRTDSSKPALLILRSNMQPAVIIIPFYSISCVPATNYCLYLSISLRL